MDQGLMKLWEQVMLVRVEIAMDLILIKLMDIMICISIIVKCFNINLDLEEE